MKIFLKKSIFILIFFWFLTAYSRKIYQGNQIVKWTIEDKFGGLWFFFAPHVYIRSYDEIHWSAPINIKKYGLEGCDRSQYNPERGILIFCRGNRVYTISDTVKEQQCTKKPNFVDANGTYWKFYFVHRHFKPPECKLDKYPRLYAIKSDNCINWGKPEFILHMNKSLPNYTESKYAPAISAVPIDSQLCPPQICRFPFPKWTIQHIFQIRDSRIWLFFSKNDYQEGFGTYANSTISKLLKQNVSLCVFNNTPLKYGLIVYWFGTELHWIQQLSFYSHWYTTSKDGGKTWSKPIFIGDWGRHTQNLVKVFPGRDMPWLLISKNKKYFLRFSRDAKTWSKPKEVKIPPATIAGYSGKNNLWIAYSIRKDKTYNTYLIKCDLLGNCEEHKEEDNFYWGLGGAWVIALLPAIIFLLFVCWVYKYKKVFKKIK